VFVPLLHRVVIFGEVGASHRPQIAKDCLLVSDMLQLTSKVLLLGTHPWHLHKQQLL
jgi:hypothetical protein